MPFDDGAAPNPYWGVCTLVVCKPGIRRTAAVGDWVVGTGSKHARLGDGSTRDLSGRGIYAMKVTGKMTMKEYDSFTSIELPQKVPDWGHRDRRRRLGDSLYAFIGSKAKQRRGVHGSANVATDLSGKNALLSNHFFYFGESAIRLPAQLRPIAQNWQGHRVTLNKSYVAAFVGWIGGLGHQPGAVLGKPLLDLFCDKAAGTWCAGCRAEEDEQDREQVRGTHDRRAMP